ncbi:IclR family transcriptional regulator [Staphylococcus sp. EZ-P03]|uniref:IclR family transcriptional regulator n=1 Tax=Staphylococcus sp. EZ-P03 TaxID=2282739 RepID=UPI000DF817A7|nr:IclR family transcriptional regulator [Staphylococcus sp. EZ-P03]
MSKVQSIDRALNLLEIIGQSGPLSLMELVEKSQLTKSTVHRLVNSLIDNNFVKKDNLTNQYALTYKLFQLGNNSVKNIDYLNIAKSLISRLSIETNETCHLVIEDNHEVLYIEKFIPSNSTNYMASKIGQRAPMYCTAVGKSILSTYSNDEIEDIWNQSKIYKYTENTIDNLNDLLLEINQIRSLGYAEDKEENEIGIRCIGSYFVNHRGEVQGAISLSFPKENIENKDFYVQSLKSITNSISKHLGA